MLCKLYYRNHKRLHNLYISYIHFEYYNWYKIVLIVFRKKKNIIHYLKMAVSQAVSLRDWAARYRASIIYVTY